MKLFFGTLEGGGKRQQRGVAMGFEGYATKLADALLDVGEPFLYAVKPMTAAAAERVAMLAALAWNAELAPDLFPEERAVVEQAIAESNEETRRLIAVARERKRVRHGDDDRLVIGIEISGAPPAFRFRAAGTSLRPRSRQR
jgi:hypothetical protein